MYPDYNNDFDNFTLSELANSKLATDLINGKLPAVVIDRTTIIELLCGFLLIGLILIIVYKIAS